MESSSFDTVNAAQSAHLYRQLTDGRVIVKHQYHEGKGELVENPLFTLVFNHWSHFVNLYRHLGYELALQDKGDFFYLREFTELGLDEADTNAFKVQVVLLLIGRYYTRTGRDLSMLELPSIGLDESDIKALSGDDEMGDILRTAKFNKGWPEALEYLLRRNFAFRTSETSLFLSSAGYAFLERLVQEYEAASPN